MSVVYTITSKKHKYSLTASSPPAPQTQPTWLSPAYDFNINFLPMKVNNYQVNLMGTSIPVGDCSLKGQGPCSVGNSARITNIITLVNVEETGRSEKAKLISCVNHQDLLIYFAQNMGAHRVGAPTDPSFKCEDL